MNISKFIQISPDNENPRYCLSGYVKNPSRKSHDLDAHLDLVLIAINDRSLTVKEKAKAISQRTGINVTVSALKGFVNLRFTDCESKPTLSSLRPFIVKLMTQNFSAPKIKRKISDELGYSYNVTSIQKFCAEIRRGGKKKPKIAKDRVDYWGADFYTGSTRTRVLCKPWLSGESSALN